MTIPSALLRQWYLGEKAKGLCLNRQGRWVAASLCGGYVALAFSEDAGENPQIVKTGESDIVSVIPDCDDHAFLILNEQGQLFITEPQVQIPVFLTENKNISAIASSASGHRAYVVDKTIHFINEDGEEEKQVYTTSSPIRKLDYNETATKLAVLCDAGIEVVSVETGRKTTFIALDNAASFSWIDAKIAAIAHGFVYLWTNLQEAPKIFKETSYQMTPRLCGQAGKKFLAVSGARQTALLPLTDEDTCCTIGGIDRRVVTAIAPHPYEPFLMVGYDDGMIVMAPLDGRIPIMIHAPTAPTGASVKGLIWNPHGDCLSALLESGWLMLFTETSIKKAIRARLT